MTSTPPIQSGAVFSYDGQTVTAQNADKPQSLSLSDDGVLRFEIDPGDKWSADPATKNRSEIAVLDNLIAEGAPVHVAYTLSVEPGTGSNAIIGQFHQDEQTNGIAPPLSIALVNDKMVVTIGYVDSQGVQATKMIFTDVTPITRGADYAMNINVTFSANGAGHVDITRNGQTIADYDGPLGWSSSETLYWKEGIYGQTSDQSLAIDDKDLSITTSAASVTPITKSNAQQYSTYDSAGRKTSTIATDGFGTTTTTTFDATGALTKKVLVNPDGSQTVGDYGIQGQAYASDSRVYNAAGTLVEFDTYNAAGTKLETDSYGVTGKPYATLRQMFDASGALTSSIANNKDGSTTSDTYVAGSLTKVVTQAASGAKTVDDYGVKGQAYVSDQRVYNAAGTLVELDTYNATGTRLEADLYAVTGKPYTSLQQSFDAAGRPVSSIATNTDGSTTVDTYVSGALTKAVIRAASGAQTIDDYGIKGQAYVSDSRAYDAAGTLVELDTYNAAGIRLEADSYGVTGKPYSAIRQTFDASGALASSIANNTDGSTTSDTYASGALTKAVVRAANGAQTINDYGIKGQAYASDSRVYNAAGTLVELDTYNAAGTKLEANSYAVTGKPYTALQQTFDASGALTSSIANNTDGSTTSDTYVSGALTKAVIRAANGAQTVDDYGIKGQAYAADSRVYNAAGTLVELDTYTAAGTKLEADSYGVTGKPFTTLRQTFDASGALASSIANNTDGSTTSDTYASGALTKAVVRAANGAQTVDDYGIKGQSYVSDQRVYNSAGTLLEFDATRPNGSLQVQATAQGRTLSGTSGNDLFTGAGKDTFVFTSAFGNDAVTNFAAGSGTNHDVLQLSKAGGMDFSNLNIHQQGTDTIVAIDPRDTITLQHVAASTLVAGNFSFV